MQYHYALSYGSIPTLSDALYRHTLRILKFYRSYSWQLKVFTCRVSGFSEASGTAFAEPLSGEMCRETGVYSEQERQKLRNQISFLSESLSGIDGLVDLIRNYHPYGEQYYWILYYTYLSPKKPECTDEILELLSARGYAIPRRTYFRRRKEAVETLAVLVGQKEELRGAGQ